MSIAIFHYQLVSWCKIEIHAVSGPVYLKCEFYTLAIFLRFITYFTHFTKTYLMQ